MVSEYSLCCEGLAYSIDSQSENDVFTLVLLVLSKDYWIIIGASIQPERKISFD